ncbi:diguanylate cyclase [Leptolyngbya sp. 'hensonii']|uniref:bifunctional diguanylate cyclase/phosphodiesterase n=1 Tax=Leptolyngbya sp. 'hensonii' TaxID=1922337 RepID=UPI0009500855|nr:EAL domain-containing protein [Leptolyngbya sp. 'hensonii']OLP20017.1 diguanylate cyclase [Leptolyngbya sp. 'hensonii']
MPDRKYKTIVGNISRQESLLNRITNRIRQSLELEEILSTAVLEIRAFLDTDRVKIYRFSPDGSGEVIAEAIEGNALPSLLGLNFPAGDIPEPSREMFIKARQRVIVDVVHQQKTVSNLDCTQTGKNLPTADIRHAIADPCHLEYLSNMGVRSSLAIPILHQRQLWGLLVSHHSQRRTFSEQELQLAQLLVDQISIAIAQSNLLEQARQLAEYEATLNRISSLLHSPLNMAEIHQSVLEETVLALDGSGGRLYIHADSIGQPAQLYTCGEQPEIPWLEEDASWEQLMHSQGSERASNPLLGDVKAWDIAQTIMRAQVGQPSFFASKPLSLPYLYSISNLYQDERFHLLAPTFQATQIRSVLIVALQYHQQCVGYLTVFRHEIETETLWAGRDNLDERNGRPRASFAAWREIKKGQAQTWTQDDVKLAHALGIHIYMSVMQRRVEAMIRHQASHDQLTGLPNRLFLNDRLSLELINAHRQNEVLAVLFLDLDRFKTINDTLGHAMGDQLLQSVTDRLRGCLREGDFIARWGGDEFTLLLPQITSPEDATHIARRILHALSQTFWFEDHEFYVTASIGIALAPYDGEDVETLLKNADTAMYRAKQQGKNNYQLYTSAMNGTALEQLVLENNLRKALEREELILHYQPQLDLNTGEVISMEALIRWQHPELGLVPPSQFIPLAEETGLICPIGEWVLRSACQQNQAWQMAGLPRLRVAVNISGRQFQQKNLVKTITQILEETGLNPEDLEIEITESVAVQDVDFTIAILQQLRDMGIHVAIDDFGTGYSSLSSLKRFPLNTLKIDRSFVRDLASNTCDAAIVRAVVSLGQGLNLQVMAEGVETQEQMMALCKVGCTGVQGYFFSKPLPIDAATLYLRSYQVNLRCHTGH